MTMSKAEVASRSTLARKYGRKIPCCTVLFLAWAIRHGDKNGLDPLQSDWALHLAWVAWKAGQGESEADHRMTKLVEGMGA